MNVNARAFWLAAPGRGEIRQTPLTTLGTSDVLVRATFSAISRGTESLVFRGQVPESQHHVMRCPFQDGGFPAPVKYGYASVGIVEQGPPALTGKRVFALYPHQDRYVVPEDAIIEIPDAVPDRRATLAANMETAVNGLWDAGPRIGDRIAVIGAGVVGCLIASLAAKLPGAHVTLIDVDAKRAEIAAALGCNFALPAKAEGECDLVVHTSGNAAGLSTALSLAGFEATVLEMSWYGDKQVAVPLGEAFHSRRLVLKSSQVGAVATARRARRTYRQRLNLALELLADPVYDRLITGETALDQLPEKMAQLARDPAGALCEIVRYF
jgi:threonine dehydrogenase-like Zn-dependent dehydrogenase